MTLILDHVHEWHPFGAGRGCGGCEAWEFWPLGRVEMIDALPTGLLQQPPKPVQDVAVDDDDLALDVMNTLLPVLRRDISWSEMAEVTSNIIELVRARS